MEEKFEEKRGRKKVNRRTAPNSSLENPIAHRDGPEHARFPKNVKLQAENGGYKIAATWQRRAFSRALRTPAQIPAPEHVQPQFLQKAGRRDIHHEYEEWSGEIMRQILHRQIVKVQKKVTKDNTKGNL